jgi:hypothetical protein
MGAVIVHGPVIVVGSVQAKPVVPTLRLAGAVVIGEVLAKESGPISFGA